MIPRIDDPEHTCLTCWWFQFPSIKEYDMAKAQGRLPPLGNRGCRYKGNLMINGGHCARWHNMYTRWEQLKILLGLKKARRRGIVR